MNRVLGCGLIVLAVGVGTRDAVAKRAAGSEHFFMGSAAGGSAHGAPQGYLGVDVRDVGDDRLAALKLKDTHGAEITLVDHDAPAGKAGLRERDVVLQLNGQAVDGEEPMRRMLRESPPGRTIVLLISRDGQQMTVTTQMANRDEVERQAWVKHFTVPEPQDSTVTESAGSGYIAPSLPSGRGNSFIGSILMSPSYTGAMLEQMSTQLASFFGVSSGSGLLVRSVAPNSPAEMAGMRAGDVVVRADAKTVTTTSDWAKAVKSSHGRPLTITVLRDKKEQTLRLVPDGKRRSALEQFVVEPERTVMAHLGLTWMALP